MKWPWVSRETYEQALHEIRVLERNVQDARFDAEHWFRTNDKTSCAFTDLLEKYHSLKLHGAALGVPPQTAVQPLAPKARDEVFEAIELQAGGDRSLQRHLSKWAAMKKLEGMEPLEIINQVLHWHSADDDDFSEDPMSHTD